MTAVMRDDTELFKQFMDNGASSVAKLPGHRKAVLLEPSLRLRVVLRGRAVEQIQVQRSVLDPVAQHVDGAAPADLALLPACSGCTGPCSATPREICPPPRKYTFSGLRWRCCLENRQLQAVAAYLGDGMVGAAGQANVRSPAVVVP